MIELILKILDIGDMYGESKAIDIAKGVNKTPLNIVDGWKRRKRIRKWQ